MKIVAEQLVGHSRRRALEQTSLVLKGRIGPSEESDELFSPLAHLSDAEWQAVGRIVEEATVKLVFQMLLCFEEYDENLKLSYRDTEEGEFRNAAEDSDGLHGEIFGKNGWLELYGTPEDNLWNICSERDAP